jgi:predicted DNA-binding transcriptional regulator AlpA
MTLRTLQPSQPSPSELALLTQTQVAGMVGCSSQTISDWLKKGMFPRPAVVNGHRRRWNIATIRDWLTGK